MKVDFTELERALPKDDYDHFIREFSSELQQSVINFKNENSILSPLAVGTQQMPFKSNIFRRLGLKVWFLKKLITIL